MNTYPECVTWVEKGGGSPFIPIPLVLSRQDNIPQTASKKKKDPIYNCVWASNFKKKGSAQLPKYISLYTFEVYVLIQQLVCNSQC